MNRSTRFLAYGAAGWLSEIVTTGVLSARLVRPAYAPLWCLVGLALERLHDWLDGR